MKTLNRKVFYRCKVCMKNSDYVFVMENYKSWADVKNM